MPIGFALELIKTMPKKNFALHWASSGFKDRVGRNPFRWSSGYVQSLPRKQCPTRDFKAVIDAAFFPHGQRAQRMFFMRKFADHDAPDFKRFHKVPGQVDKEIMTDRSDGPFDDAVEPIAHFVKHLMDVEIERLDQEVRPGYDDAVMMVTK